MTSNVTPITHKADQLVAGIRADLLASGQARADEGAEPEAWRRAARRAGRELGRPIRTLVFDGTAYAQLRDWPANGAEEAISLEQQRQAMERVSAYIGWTDPRRPLRPVD